MTTLRIATWGNPVDDSAYAKTIQELYAQFERENPGVVLEAETVPDDYVSKIVLDINAGTPPDVMMLDGASSVPFIRYHLIQDLRPYIEATHFDLSAFFPNTLAIADRGNQVFAIPQDFTPMVVYYDKTAFARNHIPEPDGSWNFQQFRDVAKKLTRAYNPGAKNRFGFAATTWMPGWVMWLWNNSGEAVSGNRRVVGVLDSPQNCQTIQFLSDLVTVDHVSPSPADQTATGVDLFANGDSAMTVGGHWSLISYKSAPINPATGKPNLDWHNLGVAPLPHNTKASHTVLYESGFAIPRGALHSDLAWKFIQFMTSRTAQMKYNSSGIAIDARKDVANARATTPLERQFLAIVPSGRPPYGSEVEGWTFAETLCQSAVEAVFSQQMTVQKALHKAAQTIQVEFSKP